MTALMEAQNICKYFGGLKALEKVSMQVHKGDIFGIIGPNGAGKTTLFNICSGIYNPTHGNVSFLGENITSLASDRIARLGMARTFQNIQLFNFMTVLENVKIGFHIRTTTGILSAILRNKTHKYDETFIAQKSMEILEHVGLASYKDTLASNLPYGIQRKVEIARALALDPKVLLLDEPAAGMNPIETKELSDFILRLNKEGYTIVVIEHDMKFVMNTCTRIMVLNFGQKICEGTPEVVKNDENVKEAYFGKGIFMGGGAIDAYS